MTYSGACATVAHGVEALAPRASGDLVEVPRGEDRRLVAAVAAELREQYGADGHVDAHAQRVCAADDLQQALLRELFDQDAVAGQQARVVQADPMPQPALELRP